jgi:hypothetical protein
MSGFQGFAGRDSLLVLRRNKGSTIRIHISAVQKKASRMGKEEKWGLDNAGQPDHYRGMPKRSRKPRLPDPAEMASGIVRAISGDTPAEPAPADDGKDPAAVALGRKGGLVGGKARAKKMSKAERVASARKAALARWKKKPTV